ncbi:hypothetical protein QBC46DRAFT_394896 [Diplogelasinospora grovesii]|uniref:Uncharacterized protein n=1 Tax=Diplogelasinospora grovesii TaxID=303347 RepID=A0AAN6S114_9PEZI|nr:hypothetical protein QBC46DRAFT_394896 [Diplogelasinospora grovesii]
MVPNISVIVCYVLLRSTTTLFVVVFSNGFFFSLWISCNAPFVGLRYQILISRFAELLCGQKRCNNRCGGLLRSDNRACCKPIV